MPAALAVVPAQQQAAKKPLEDQVLSQATAELRKIQHAQQQMKHALNTKLQLTTYNTLLQKAQAKLALLVSLSVCKA